MKKNIALILALVMILSLIPMTAFATSTNVVDRTPVVGKNDLITNGAVTLTIDAKDGTWTGKTAQEVFEVQLGEGAKWAKDGAGVFYVEGEDDTHYVFDVLAGEKIMEVTFTPSALTATGIEIPMWVKLSDAPNGEQKVTVNGLDSVVSSASYTYAIVEAGATVATATSSTLSGRSLTTVGSIRIQETVKGTVEGTQEFRLRLPKDFSWDTDWNAAGDVAPYISFTGFDAAAAITAVVVDNGGRDLTLTTNNLTEDISRGTITFIPYIQAAKDAPTGDVAVSLTGLGSSDISNASGLVIADFKDYGYSIDVSTEADDDEFVAGWRDDDAYVVTMTIEEDIANTLFPERFVDVELPSWVKIASGTSIYLDTTEIEEVTTGDVDSFEFSMPDSASALDFDIEFTIVVAGTATVDGPRDIVATLVGAGMDDEVVIGTAIPSVTVEVEEKAMLEVGTQKQMAPALIITEQFPGALREGNLEFAAGGLFEGSARFDGLEAEVLEGDIELDGTDTDDDMFSVTIDAISEEASVIRLYDIEITLDRTVPMGDFRLDVKGDAVLDAGNTAHDDCPDRIMRIAAYFEVGTPVDGVMTDPQITFTIGQSGYLVDGEMMLMDTAPFISEGRTMVPVKYLEELFGMAPIWNASSRTVTIMYENKVYEMAIGSTWLKVNGANFLEMETPAMIVDDRTFVPLSRFALAMGIDYTWDQATQTVVFN